jgi:hypothetical protein
MKIVKLFGMLLVFGSAQDKAELMKFNGVSLAEGARLVTLPKHFHIHRNPIRKPILRYIEGGKNEHTA